MQINLCSLERMGFETRCCFSYGGSRISSKSLITTQTIAIFEEVLSLFSLCFLPLLADLLAFD